MLDRLKGLLSGADPGDTGPSPPPSPGRLDGIDETTPYRFRTWLADASQREAAIAVLEERLGHEITATAVDEPDGRVRLDLVSTFQGLAAIPRPLHVLRREGVRVRGIEMLDLYDDVAPDELGRLAAAWEARPYDRTLRRRVDALAGETTLRAAIDANRRGGTHRAWRQIAATAARHTAGVDALLLETAIAERDSALARLYAGVVGARGELAELVSTPFEPPVDLVLAVAKRGDDVAEAAYDIAQHLPAPLPDELTAVFSRAARRGTESSHGAVRALRRAAPSDEVRTALEAALASSVLDVADAALGTLAEILGSGARRYWQAGLASSSAPRRMAAEDVIGQYGDADDVALAAEHLAKIIRRRSATSWQPPRGSDIIGLLVRHRELPEARAALSDLTKRWAKLPEELQEWLHRFHPDLVPADPRPTSPTPSPDPGPENAEPPLVWPLPSIERKGNELHVAFWDTDVTDIRDRFGELIDAHPAVAVLDGDREWLTLRIDAPDPEAVIAELWEVAHRGSADG